MPDSPNVSEQKEQNMENSQMLDVRFQFNPDQLTEDKITSYLTESIHMTSDVELVGPVDRQVRHAIATAMVEEIEKRHGDYGAVQAYGVALARLTTGDAESVADLEDGIQNWVEPILDREVDE